jgi:hypothetical protein
MRPEEIEDRALLRERDMMTVWIVYSGVRYGFPSVEALHYAGFELGQETEVPPGSLIRIPHVPPDGTIVQEFRSGDLFIIARGRRLRMTEDDLDVLGRRGEVIGVPWGTLGGVPFAARYAWWTRGALGRLTIPVAVYLRRPWPQRVAAWLFTAIVGGVLSGLIVAWLVD